MVQQQQQQQPPGTNCPSQNVAVSASGVPRARSNATRLAHVVLPHGVGHWIKNTCTSRNISSIPLSGRDPRVKCLQVMKSLDLLVLGMHSRRRAHILSSSAMYWTIVTMISMHVQVS